MIELANPKEKYHDFELERILEIPEIQVVLRELTHTPTGARVIHLEADDPENLFCISFKTIPEDSKGVAHILEHIVLAGSERFPVRDPFFSMTRRSLNTFMNAFTGSDFTSYPAASQVERDFYNLLEVYIDAVFRPRIDRFSFLQEGHRLEFDTPDDSSSPLKFKGVVFNEMKGALTSPTTRLYDELSRALYPDITYGVNSGGDPKVITDLSYQELLDFHKTHYHPSRSIFFFYGDIPLYKHLDFIQEHALKGVKKVAPLPAIPTQKRFTKPKVVEAHYPAESSDDLTYLTFGWLTCAIKDQEELLALNILDTLLMGTDAAPLKRALLRSGLCSAAFSFMESDVNEIPYAFVLNGCDAKQTEAIETFLFTTLKEIAEEGFQNELIESAIHQIEFDRSEITEEGYPHGLNLFFRSALLTQHGILPEEGLKIHSLFDQLRKELNANPNFFQDLIKKWLLDNPHRVRLLMTPSTELAKQEAEAEEKKLLSIREKLTEKEISQIITEANQLKELQDADEDIEVLPKISINEVPLEPKDFALNHETLGPLNIYHHDCFTNSILYADVSYDLPPIPKEEWPLMRLFASLLSQMGCAGRNYQVQLEELQAYTGGIGAMLGQHPQATDPDLLIPTISIRAKSLYRNAGKLFQLLREMITSVDFTDTDRLREVIQKQATQFKSALTHNAMNYAKQLATSSLRESAELTNSCFGLPYYHYILKLAEQFANRPEAIVAQLQSMQQKLLDSTKPNVILSCDVNFYQKLRREEFYGLTALCAGKDQPWKNHANIEQIQSQGLIIASPVAFTAHAFKSVPYVHPDAPALAVASQLFENCTLHRRIREQGGAYGSGASSKSIQGIFQFYGYRDPNIASTVKAFKEAIDTALYDDFTDDELECAKLEVLQDIDSPVSPGSRADVAYIWMREGRTFERRKHFRDGVITVTRDHLKKAVQKHLSEQFEKGVTVTLAGKELLEKENQTLIHPLQIREI